MCTSSMQCPSSLCPPGLLVPVLERSRVSNPPAGVSVSRQLLTAQLNMISLKSDSERSLYFALVSRGLSRLTSHLVVEVRRHVSSCSARQICPIGRPLVLQQSVSPADYHLTALISIPSSVHFATLQLKFCWPTGTRHLTAGPSWGG